jgi:hypothetical protein
MVLFSLLKTSKNTRALHRDKKNVYTLLSEDSCTTNDYHLPRGTLPHGTEKCVTNREVVIRIDTLHAASNRLTDDI